MTVGKPGGTRKPVTTGCGAGSGKVAGDKKPARPSVSTGCGASGGGGWKPAPETKKPTSNKTSLSERARDLLDKAKGPKTRTPVASGCGASTPAKPKPATPARPAPTRTGC